MILRICTHEHSRGQSYSEICESWTLDDVDVWNTLLDGIDVANQAAMARAEKERAR
jgi:hypothetical protein